MKTWIVAITLLATLSACTKKTQGDKVPKITIGGVSQRTVKQGASDEKIVIAVKVTDGDANMPNDETTPAIFIKDSRYPANDAKQFTAPPVASVFMNPDYGFEGTYTVDMKAAFLIFKDTLNGRERDTLEWEIWVKDLAGNESNHVKTQEVYLTK